MQASEEIGMKAYIQRDSRRYEYKHQTGSLIIVILGVLYISLMLISTELHKS